MIFAEMPTDVAAQISRNERIILGVSRASLTYGEVQFSTLATIFFSKFAKLQPGGKFYDLGSGTGRAVIAAALLHDFDICVGIEVTNRLLNDSSTQLLIYNHLFICSSLPSLGDGRVASRGQLTADQIPAGVSVQTHAAQAAVCSNRNVFSR